MDLRSQLDQMGIRYTWSHHDTAYTAQDLAAKEHVSGKRVVKPVVIEADGQMMLCALPAASYVDLQELREELHARATRIVEEGRLREVCQDCETGAEPPIGELFGMPTLMDSSLVNEEQVTFQAGTHQDSITMSTRDYMRMAQPKIAHFGKKRM